MPWFKVDDALALHMKAITAGNAALGLWVRAGSWSMHQLSDGFVPHPIVAALGGTEVDTVALVDAGLWDHEVGGFQFHDWDEYQPTREQVLAERAAAAERQRKSRAKSRRDSGGTNGVSSDSPSRPVPTPDSSKTSKSQSSSRRANDGTDSELSPTLRSIANQLGLRDLAAIRTHVVAWCQRDLDLTNTIAVARHLIDKCADPDGPKAPQAYVIDAITKSPLEVQQFIDEGGFAA